MPAGNAFDRIRNLLFAESLSKTQLSQRLMLSEQTVIKCIKYGIERGKIEFTGHTIRTGGREAQTFRAVHIFGEDDGPRSISTVANPDWENHFEAHLIFTQLNTSDSPWVAEEAIIENFAQYFMENARTAAKRALKDLREMGFDVTCEKTPEGWQWSMPLAIEKYQAAQRGARVDWGATTLQTDEIPRNEGVNANQAASREIPVGNGNPENPEDPESHS